MTLVYHIRGIGSVAPIQAISSHDERQEEERVKKRRYGNKHVWEGDCIVVDVVQHMMHVDKAKRGAQA